MGEKDGVEKITSNSKYKKKEGPITSIREVFDSVMGNTLKSELKEAFDQNKPYCITLSTKDFPRPLRMGKIQRRVKEILRLLITDKAVLNDVLIAVEEAVANIIEHSYGEKCDPLIDFHFIFQPQGLIIRLVDYGQQGKDFSIQDSLNYLSIEDIRKRVHETGGGMGVYIIRQVMDDVSYESQPEQYNRITMIKNFTLK